MGGLDLGLSPSSPQCYHTRISQSDSGWRTCHASEVQPKRTNVDIDAIHGPPNIERKLNLICSGARHSLGPCKTYYESLLGPAQIFLGNSWKGTPLPAASYSSYHVNQHGQLVLLISMRLSWRVGRLSELWVSTKSGSLPLILVSLLLRWWFHCKAVHWQNPQPTQLVSVSGCLEESKCDADGEEMSIPAQYQPLFWSNLMLHVADLD